MDHALTVCIGERRSHLRDEAARRIDTERAPFERGAHAAGAQPSHHEIRARRIAHEVGLVRQVGSDDLDRNLATDRYLACPIHDSEVARAQTLTHLVSRNRQTEPWSGCRTATDPERRERIPPELMDRCTPDTLQIVLTERQCSRSGRIGDAVGHQDLPTVADVEQPHDAIHPGTEVVAGPFLCRSDVDRHPHSERAGRRPVLSGELALDLGGRRYR